MESSIKWIVTIIVIMATIIYLNQEVPACIDNPIVKSTAPINISIPEINNISVQLESDVLVFKTSGDSMEPYISDNQKCVCMKSSSYQVGDTVVFFANFGQGYEGIAHRIINIDGEEVTTKGTNNAIEDNHIKMENILCKIPTTKRINLFI